MRGRHRKPAWCLVALVPLVLALSACGGGTELRHSNTGVVRGNVRVFGGGPIEPTPLPLSPVPARIEVESQGRVVAHEHVGPRRPYRFSLAVGRYVVVASLDETSSETRSNPLTCAPVATTIRSGSTPRLDVRCFGTAR